MSTGNSRPAVVISISIGAFLTAVLYIFAQLLHQNWAERIAAPFALASFAVNVHQGSVAVMLGLMFVAFSFVSWVIIEGLRLEGRRRAGEEP